MTYLYTALATCIVIIIVLLIMLKKAYLDNGYYLSKIDDLEKELEEMK